MPDLASDVIAEIQARYEKREMIMEAGKVDDVGFEFDLPQLHSDIAALLSLAKRAGEMETALRQIESELPLTESGGFEAFASFAKRLKLIARSALAQSTHATKGGES